METSRANHTSIELVTAAWMGYGLNLLCSVPFPDLQLSWDFCNLATHCSNHCVPASKRQALYESTQTRNSCSLNGLAFGFHIGFGYEEHGCKSTKQNMFPALQTLEDYLQTELAAERIMGPSEEGDIPAAQVSRVGKANQPRLILDLSSPYGHLQRGDHIFRQKGNVVVTVWKDKKPVYIMSSNCMPTGDTRFGGRRRMAASTTSQAYMLQDHGVVEEVGNSTGSSAPEQVNGQHRGLR